MTLLDEDDAGPRAPALELADEVPPLVRVRRWTGEVLVGLTDDELEDCLLVVTELVANAYDHARAPRRLRLYPSPDRHALRIEVEDGSPDRLPVLGTSSLGQARGRGLIMVDSLSLRHWGTQVLPDGKAVWAELPLS